MNEKAVAIIAGAGPAGLTAAYELLTRTNIQPIIFEKTLDIGGISKTVNYKGNRIDIGGHRFFSKSDRVMDWWLNILPLQENSAVNFLKNINEKKSDKVISNKYLDIQSKHDKVMLLRTRISRIYFIKKFFKYPLAFSLNTLLQLGVIRTFKILISYISIRLKPIKNEENLEDFIINRFGKELYFTFFKGYSEKVWGKSCCEIPATWGKQRIKTLSISGAIRHALKKRMIFKKINDVGIDQKGTETSLIEKFLYPKLGPGQLWEEVASKIIEMGGQIIFDTEIVGVHREDNNIVSVSAKTGQEKNVNHLCSYFFSTMPVTQLITSLTPRPYFEVYKIATELQYRDFITVGLLLSDFGLHTNGGKKKELLKDNWIYVQDDNVQVGRIQIFNNWSPAMVNNKANIWIGMEYFCDHTDKLWKLPNEDLSKLAIEELQQLGLSSEQNFIDSTVIRMEKAYPAYFGSYNQFDKIIEYTDKIDNLFLIGRNGMHRYNNSDHSMLTAMMAVDNIIAGIKSKQNLWKVNTEDAYHEHK